MSRTLALALAVILLSGCGGGSPPASPTASVAASASTGSTTAELDFDIALTAPAVDALPGSDPFDAAWDKSPEVEVALLPQIVTTPNLDTPGVSKLAVRILHDGTRVAFRLVWADATANGDVDTDKSSDGVAVELPANAPARDLPNVMMGDPQNPVSVSLWRYAYQEIADGHGHGVARLYPNASFDYYPSSGSKRPEVKEELDRITQPGRNANNPVTTQLTPVADLTARGFGSLSAVATPVTGGRGVHRDGKWHVVITRPLADAAGGLRLRAGEPTAAAFAVWEGSQNQRGARKTWSNWIGFVLNP